MSDQEKSPAERLDEVLNHMRSQLDFICESIKWQNEVLKDLYNNSNNRSNQSEDTDN